jgi:arabinan endo-1,5-alpha-L-arabinosidase
MRLFFRPLVLVSALASASTACTTSRPGSPSLAASEAGSSGSSQSVGGSSGGAVAGGAAAGGDTAGGDTAGGALGTAASANEGAAAGTGGGSTAGGLDSGNDTHDAASDAASDAATVLPPPNPQACGTTWKNTITTGAHDPSLVKDGNVYYVYSTAESLAAGIRTVPFQTSTDRSHWNRLGNLMSAVPAWGASLGLAGTLEVWAPDIHFVNGKYFLYYSVSSWGDVTHSAIGLMTNTTLDPKAAGYQWIDQGKVVGSPEGGAGVNVIDPDLFVDDDGSWWLVYGSFQAGIRVVPLDSSTGLWKRATAPVVLTTSLGEGSDIIKNNGFYYLFVSRGTCCAALKSSYEVVYGRATKITGPYVGKNGSPIATGYVNLLPAGSDGNPGQGGQSFFEENGQHYMVYHAYQPPSGEPVLNIRPIYFDANDWVTLDPCLAKNYRL